MKQFFKDKRPQNGMTYKEYRKVIIDQIENENPESLNEEQTKTYAYKKLNMQRRNRIDNNYKPSEELVNTIKAIKDKQLWMVITEPWCGDSAQNLPYIAKIAAINGNIDLRIILRDSNPDIMDEYLTNGTRSIPKLVVFDTEGNEILTWGPRPKAAQELIRDLKSKGIVKPELYEKLHLWYARNKGHNIEEEFTEIFANVEQD